MNSAARKLVGQPGSSNAILRKPVEPTRFRPLRRYSVHLHGLPGETLVESVSPEAAAITFAERELLAENHAAVVVTDCETGCSESFLLDVDEASIGSC